jgi:plastocyanin
MRVPRAALQARMVAVVLMATATATAALAACGGSSGGSGGSAGPPPPGAAVTVDIRNVSFNPTSVTIHSGQMVAWKFDDGIIAHNVTGNGWSSADRTSGYYSHTFTTLGTYAYRCTIHSNMEGQVVVTP